MTVLVYVEHAKGAATGGSLGVLGAGRELARQLGTDLVALVAGEGVADVAAGLGAYGASRVLVADDARFGAPIAGALTDAICAAVDTTGATVLLMNASVLAAEIAGGVAGRHQAGINVDGVAIRADEGRVVHVRPALEDTTYVECGYTKTDGFQGVSLFRAGAFQAASPNGGSATVEPLSVPDSGRRTTEFRGVETAATGGVDITQADVLVGGGRGLGGPEHFTLVEELAKTLGGEVATTRAVVDAGWYGYATQVGQTGKTVAPKLYIAVGISGAIQHKVGMQNSGTIVAINKDPNAPIFDYADFGVVGDLFTVLPKLEAKLKERKG